LSSKIGGCLDNECCKVINKFYISVLSKLKRNIFVVMDVFRKIAIHFFSVYLVVLMVLPCTEGHTAENFAVTLHSHQDTPDDNTHHENELCTPFCVCGSCVVAVVIYPVLEITFFQPEHRPMELPNFYSSFKSDFYGSIWQPPQLV
jgi:hypothetical protein